MPEKVLGAGKYGLTLSFLLFVAVLDYWFPSFSTYGSAVVLSFTFLIIFYATACGLYKSRPSRTLGLLISISFVLSIALFLLATFGYVLMGMASAHEIYFIENLVVFFMMLFLLFFILEVYFYTRNKWTRVFILLIAVILVVLYFSNVRYIADDETTLSYYGLASFLNGSNPYSQSFSAILYNLHESSGLVASISTSNRIAGSIQYPALFFLISLPLYLLANPTASNLTGNFLHYQAITFFLIFILAYLLVAEKGKRSGPAILAYISLALLFNSLSSMPVFIMAALILVQYSDVGSRYSWLFLGLAASIQEQLWVLVALFAAYSFNTKGIKRGFMDVAGIIAVFIAINGYFIIMNPAAFINNIFGTATSLLPNSLSPIGYALITLLNVSLNTTTYLFAVSILATILLSLYINEKKLILIFSIIPFLFLGHGLLMYYVLPLSIFAIISAMGFEEKSRNLLKRSISRSAPAKYAYYGTFAALALLSAYMILASHGTYSSHVGISISNISISMRDPRTLAYSSDIRYVPDTSMKLSLLIQESAAGSVGYLGLYNDSIINSSLNCSFPCSVNVNIINLSGSGNYNLTAYLPANMPTPAYISAVLYNTTVYYASPAVSYIKS
ncbi:MAG: hypothetical protein M1569_01235 [Candidatus Marsarchaeota archaeon]|nr:hypothetical protein [Candidatus Marsarchaeota archaeon]MCL5413012.1 hypothetical protein [Candidatus Marsarchaeota archaeon]